MAESVDALVSNTSGATHPGSTPGLGTKGLKAILCEWLFAGDFCLQGRFLCAGAECRRGIPKQKIQNHMMKEVLAKVVLLTALGAVFSESCGQDAHEIAARNGAVS